MIWLKQKPIMIKAIFLSHEIKGKCDKDEKENLVFPKVTNGKI